MDPEQSRKESRLRSERRHRPGAQTRPSLDGEDQPGDETGQAAEPPVGCGVVAEVPGHQGGDQRPRLMEGHRDPFARDGVEIPCGIPHQRDALARHAAHPLLERTGTAVPRCERHAREPGGEAREAGEEVVEPTGGAAPEDRHPHQVRRHRRDIGLAPGPPVDLDVVAPGREREVPADAEAAAGRRRRRQPGPLPHPRAQAVRADGPAGGERAGVGLDAVGPQAADHDVPGQLGAGLLGPPHQRGVKGQSAHAEPRPLGKVPGRHQRPVQVADPAEAEALAGGEDDAELAQERRGVGHQTLAAGFVDRRAGAVEDPHREPRAARLDSGGEPGGPAADDHQVKSGPHAAFPCARRRSASAPPPSPGGAASRAPAA